MSKALLYKARVYYPLRYDDEKVRLWVGYVAANNRAQARRISIDKAGAPVKGSIVRLACMSQHALIEQSVLGKL